MPTNHAWNRQEVETSVGICPAKRAHLVNRCCVRGRVPSLCALDKDGHFFSALLESDMSAIAHCVTIAISQGTQFNTKKTAIGRRITVFPAIRITKMRPERLCLFGKKAAQARREG